MRHFVAILILLWGTVGLIFSDEVIQIGAFGQEGELIFPQQIAEGPDEHIYVYDQQDAFIKVYSPSGKFIRKIGGRGQGPGEIQRVEGVTFGFMPDGNLYFTEYFAGHPWITLMDKSGELIKVIHINIKERFGVTNIFPLSDGNFLAELSFVGLPKKQNEYYLQSFPERLFLLNDNLDIISRINESENFTRISFHRFGRDAGLPFIPKFLWCPFKENTVLFTDGMSNKFKVFDYHGKLMKEIITPLPEPELVSKEDLSRWRAEWKEVLLQLENGSWYRQFGRVIEKYKKSIYPMKPILDDISSTPDGNILVTGIRNSKAKEVDYWLINEVGEKLLDIKLPFRTVKITQNFIFYTTLDEDDMVQVFCMKRTASEMDDLMKLQSLH